MVNDTCFTMGPIEGLGASGGGRFMEAETGVRNELAEIIGGLQKAMEGGLVRRSWVEGSKEGMCIIIGHEGFGDIGNVDIEVSGLTTNAPLLRCKGIRDRVLGEDGVPTVVVEVGGLIWIEVQNCL